MNRYLLGNLEDGTPDVLIENGCRKQGRGMFGLFLVAFFAVSLNMYAWAADPLVDGGVYLIRCKKTDFADFYVYPQSNTVQVAYSMNVEYGIEKGCFWCAERVEIEGEGVFYRFKNFDETVMGSGSNGIHLKNVSPPVNTNAIGYKNYVEGDNSFLFKLVSRNNSYAVIPYEHRNTNYSWYLYKVDSDNNKRLGLKDYTSGNDCLWDFILLDNPSSVLDDPQFVLTDPCISGPTPITVGNASYEFTHSSSQCFLFFGSIGYGLLSSNSSTPNYTTYTLSYEGLPAGTTCSVTSSKWTLSVGALPNSAMTVTLKCLVTRYQLNEVVVQKEYRFPVIIGQPHNIDNLSEITDFNGCYFLNGDIENASGYNTIPNFTGYFDGQNHTIKGLSVPLFGTMTNAVVHNVNLENVNINETRDTDNTGAIANVANGASRIYNVGILSGSVGGTGNTGGLVGLLDGSARVINCFSYADITSGTVKAGIVGHNNFPSVYYDIRTMVMNCMFYGNIATGGTISPIYGGEEISNEGDSRLNNYNYYLYESPFSYNNTTTTPIFSTYNHAMAAEKRYLVRWEFYRNLVNSTRELASWYVFGSVQSDAHTKMLKWVLDKDIAPYPILKVQDSYTPGDYTSGLYPSVVNYDPDYTFNPATGEKVLRSSVTTRNQGGKLTTMGNSGSLSVTISQPATASGGKGKPDGASLSITSRTLPIIDKDTALFNFNYGKVQLPYYNEVGTGNYTHNKVVTGWMITDITEVAGDPYTAAHYTGDNYDSPYYNFADRKSSNKDLYSISHRVFSQGAYFDVPDGVTAITIEPYWACAAYLSDEGYDSYYTASDDTWKRYNVNTATSIFGRRYNSNGTSTFNGSDQNVYTSFSNALSQLDALGRSTSTPIYDYAVVLVGNYHQKGMPENTQKRFTVMSVDFNYDNEPDYSLIIHSGKQEMVSPMRLDFINVPNAAMAHKLTSYTYMGILGNIKPKGWFETTNTAVLRFSQYEYDSENKNLNEPLILMGGLIDMFTSTNGSAASRNTKYMIVGGNVWFQVFNIGCHMDKTYSTPHRPISVCGGEYEKFYLSGYLRPDASVYNTADGGQNAECYVSGGRFGEVAGAGYEKIDGDVTWQIYDADIENFYGGGINEGKPVSGNISTIIRGSNVGTFCGGPKFGNMSANKTVKTTATDCTFGTFFGAGYGGTAFTRVNAYNKYNTLTYNWNGSSENDLIVPKFTNSNGAHHRGKYVANQGISVNYDYRNFEGSNIYTVGYLFVNYASLSIAQTNDVTNMLTDCTITENFYGGGSRGKVHGDIESTLDNCTVRGNVFGAGYSVTIPTVEVFPDGNAGLFQRVPFYNSSTGVFEKGIYPEAVTYTWDNSGSTSAPFTDDGNTHLIYTDINFDDLGTVEGNVLLTIKGNSEVGTMVGEGGGQTLKPNTGDVFGGGDMSAVTQNSSHQKGNTTVKLHGNTNVLGNVFGGGNKGKVDGNTEVFIEPETLNPGSPENPDHGE